MSAEREGLHREGHDVLALPAAVAEEVGAVAGVPESTVDLATGRLVVRGDALRRRGDRRRRRGGRLRGGA